MTLIVIAVIVWIIVEISFWRTHNKPLTENEIYALAKKRQSKCISRLYSFKRSYNVGPDKQFKSSIRPSGKLYAADIRLLEFPSYVANLLKGKKHEWVVFGFVHEDKVVYFYTNKGRDGSSVTPLLSSKELASIANRYGCETVIRLHNHPNPNPQKYTALLASEQDLLSAKICSQTLREYGVNWLDFVCERGSYILFYKLFCNDFYPGPSNPAYIRQENANPRLYYRLQRELGIFHKSNYSNVAIPKRKAESNQPPFTVVVPKKGRSNDTPRNKAKGLDAKKIAANEPPQPKREEKVLPINTPPFSRDWVAYYSGAKSFIPRGKSLYTRKQVSSINRSENAYTAIVLGDSGVSYPCSFTLNKDGTIDKMSCACEAFSHYHGACKHLIATFYEANDMFN